MKDSEQTEPSLTVSDKCTLCDACSNACPTTALRIRVLDGRVQLLFGPADCRPLLCESLCVRLCPEKAISLHPPPRNGGARTVILMEDALASCTACGLPYTSERRKNRAQELLVYKKANRTAIDAMNYCPACRRSGSLISKGMKSVSRQD